jgi:hypothetical protein
MSLSLVRLVGTAIFQAVVQLTTSQSPVAANAITLLLHGEMLRLMAQEKYLDGIPPMQFIMEVPTRSAAFAIRARPMIRLLKKPLVGWIIVAAMLVVQLSL